MLPIIVFTIGSFLLLISLSRPSLSYVVSPPPLLIKLGAMSYGIYVIHFPVTILLSRFPYFSGSALTFCIRLVVYLLIVIGAGYLLELKIQPWLKARIT